MKQLIKKVLLTILALVLFVSVYYLSSGYRLAQYKMNESSLEEVIEPYTTADYVDFDDIDEDFVNAVVAIEDKRFFARIGFDWPAFIRALINNVMMGGFVEGGSTISQQIAKNLYFTNSSRGIKEKVAEVFIMLQLESDYSKEDLFALYANMNYYGDGYWGIKAASNGYYGKNPDDLSIGQSALLAGIPNAPSIYQLSSGFELAKNRQEKVLKRMYEENYITVQQYQEALEEDVSPVSQ